jgi:hypothetical protein
VSLAATLHLPPSPPLGEDGERNTQTNNMNKTSTRNVLAIEIKFIQIVPEMLARTRDVQMVTTSTVWLSAPRAVHVVFAR